MKLIDLARKILKRQTKNHAGVFRNSRAEMEAFLNRLGDPRDDEERSYYQYLAQRSQLKLIFALYNVVSAPLYFLQRRKLAVAYDKESYIKQSDLVYYIYDADRSLMPASLNQIYPGDQHVYADDVSPTLNDRDLDLLKMIARKRPFSFYYRLKILMRLGINRSLIKRYQPKIIAQCGEYSFASTVCTSQLEAEGIEHYNLLHGEKLFTLRDAYPRFTKFYVWNNHYRQLFMDMRCPPDQFVVELPPSLEPHILPHEKTVDATYYLANETSEQLQKVAESVTALGKAGLIVRLRPHPRYTDLSELSDYIPDDWIEQSDLSLDESIGRSRAAISLYSTVLNQAAAAGLEIVIDDLKAPSLFAQLKELGYLRIHEDHTRLSEYMQRMKDDLDIS